MTKSYMSVIVIVLVLTGIVFLIGFKGKDTPTPRKESKPKSSITYLPLGDSYTIGENVAESDRWPNQLVTQLKKDGLDISIIKNPAMTGYTSQNLIDYELPIVEQEMPDFVTVQIGVNDFVQGVSADVFQKNLTTIISRLKDQLDNPHNILLVTIPDFGKTPGGAKYSDPATAEAGIQKFNEIIQSVGTDNQLTIADIFPVSQSVVSDQSLLASDGLHPSGKQYSAWVEIIHSSVTTAGYFD